MPSPLLKIISISFIYMNSALLTPANHSAVNQHSEAPPLGQAREVFKIGPWVGAEQFLRNGAFFSCLMVADYGAGRSLAFGINNDHRFWFGLSSQEWQLTSGKKYTVTYVIDQSPQVFVSASAPHSSMIMADFLDKAGVFNRLQNAQALMVEIPELNETVQVNLKQIDNALSALAECVDKNRDSAPVPDAGNSPESSKKEI